MGTLPNEYIGCILFSVFYFLDISAPSFGRSDLDPGIIGGPELFLVLWLKYKSLFICVKLMQLLHHIAYFTVGVGYSIRNFMFPY